MSLDYSAFGFYSIQLIHSYSSIASSCSPAWSVASMIASRTSTASSSWIAWSPMISRDRSSDSGCTRLEYRQLDVNIWMQSNHFVHDFQNWAWPTACQGCWWLCYRCSNSYLINDSTAFLSKHLPYCFGSHHPVQERVHLGLDFQLYICLASSWFDYFDSMPDWNWLLQLAKN